MDTEVSPIWKVLKLPRVFRPTVAVKGLYVWRSRDAALLTEAPELRPATAAASKSDEQQPIEAEPAREQRPPAEGGWPRAAGDDQPRRMSMREFMRLCNSDGVLALDPSAQVSRS